MKHLFGGCTKNKDGLPWGGDQTVFVLKFILLNFVPVFFFFFLKIVLSSKVVSVLRYHASLFFICRLRILSQCKETVYIDPTGNAKCCH